MGDVCGGRREELELLAAAVAADAAHVTCLNLSVHANSHTRTKQASKQASQQASKPTAASR